MDEFDFRKSLTKVELEKRALIISFKIYDFSILERLNQYSEEFGKNWDELINIALNKFMDDIQLIHSLHL